jgi:hypothetical protein
MKLNTKSQLLCIWSSPVATVLWLLGFGVIAHFLPPPAPSWSAARVAETYHDHHLRIQIGMWICMFGAALIVPFSASMSGQMRRIEGRLHSPLAWTEFGLGALMVLLFILPCFFIEGAAFRPNESPSLIRTLNDSAMLPFVGGFFCTFFQLIAIGLCIYQDPEQKVYRRWVGHANIVCAFALLPAGTDVFFHTGPFDWGGAVTLWFVLVVFCLWFLLMFWETRRAILNEARDFEAGTHESQQPESLPVAPQPTRTPVAA